MVRIRTGDKDRQIVEAAIELFLERGVRGTTIQNIASKAGVAVGTVYVYYKDKVEIVRRVAFAFAEMHEAFAAEVLSSRREAPGKLLDYVLGFYDMWQPFGKNTVGPMEIAEAIIKNAPETLEMAQTKFLEVITMIMREAKEHGLTVGSPKTDARWIAVSTTAFFPLAGTPSAHPLRQNLTRDDLEGMLKWILKKMGA